MVKFYFGLYDSDDFDTGDLSWEIEDNKYVIDEVWKNYGEKYKVLEAGTSARSAARPKGQSMLSVLWGNNAKTFREGSRLLSRRGLMAKRQLWEQKLTREDAVSVQQHEKEWNEIFDGIHEVVDACAFQDGHIDYDELDAFFCK